MYFTLADASEVVGQSGSNITVQLGVEDLNPLRIAMTFGTDNINSFITIAEDTFFDFGNNPLDPMLTPLQPLQLITDDTGPQLLSFVLNLNLSTLILNFNEPVEESSINGTQIVLQNAPREFVVYVVLTSMSYVIEDYSTVVIMLNTRDIDMLNLMPDPATGVDDTYISFSSFTIQDLLDQRTPGIPNIDAQQVTTYIRDETRPTLNAFAINLNDYTVSLSFDEIVDPDSVNMSSLRVQNQASNPTATYYFSGQTNVTRTGRVFTIGLTQEDVNELNILNLCTSMADCYAVVDNTFINDTAGNLIAPEVPLIAENFTGDITPPVFIRFSVMNLDEGEMIIEFSETILASSVALTDLTLQNNFESGVVDFSMYTLTGGRVNGSSNELRIVLSTADLNALKSDDLLCNVRSDCYVRFPSSFATDAFGNSVSAVTNTLSADDTHYPRLFIRDTTGPLVVSFDLLLESGSMIIVFDEIFNDLTFNIRAVTLQDAVIANVSYTLTGGFDTVLNDTAVSITLLEDDVLQIKGEGFLATGVENTYLVNTDRLVADLSDNRAVVRANGINPLQVSFFEDDITPPQFLSFNVFNLETGTFTLSFDEPIDIANINYTLITLMSQSSRGSSITLTGGQAALESDPRQITISISLPDLFRIKQNLTMLAVSQDSTYLTFTTGAFRDPSGHYANGITSRLPSSFIADFEPPFLSEFEINMETSQLQLTFSDIIRPSTYIQF